MKTLSFEEELLREGFKGKIKCEEPLNKHTSVRIGGWAQWWVEPFDPYSLKVLIHFCTHAGLPMYIIGGGTNLLVSDKGIRGVVVNLKNLKEIKIIEEKDSVSLLIQAGLGLQKLLRFCFNAGYSGLEGLSGIPGTVGGAVFGNAGAFGYEMMQRVERVTVMDKKGLRVIRKNELRPSYREGGVREPIVAVEILLDRDEPEAVRSKTESFLKRKRLNQPLGEFTAGCVFKNPPEGPPAGELIDNAGLKGLTEGGIMVSPKHANFFVNLGHGTAEEFLTLMKRVHERVRKSFSVELEPEIRLIGEGLCW